MSNEIETNLDESSVTANAKPGDPQKKLENDGSSLAQKAEFSTKGDVKAGHEPEGEVIAETEETQETVIEVDLSADVAALTEGEDLSEEFKDKAKTIFEAAVVSRLNEELERMHEDYAKVLAEEIETVKSDLAEKVDDYLTYSVSQWMKANELAVEHGIKTEMAENVLTGLKQVFVENFIDLPDEKVDLVDEMTEQLHTMETKLNEQIEENVVLSKEVGGFVKNGIVSEISEGLSQTQREKLASLAEAVEFENEESFRAKVSTLRESYFSTKPQVTTVTEDVEVENAPTGDAMSAYVTALSRWASKSN